MLRIPQTLKAALGSTLFRIPFLRELAWSLLLGRKLQEGATLPDLLASAGHALDHSLSRGIKPSGSATARMRAILTRLRRQQLPLCERDLWALGLLSVSKLKLAKCYQDGIALQERRETQHQTAGNDPTQGPVLGAAITGRRSVRQWRSDPVAAELLLRVVTAGTWAPCSCNRQAWKVLIVREREEKMFLTRFYGARHNHFWTSAPIVLVILIGSSLYNKADAHYAYLDSGAFIQNLLLSAHACGLGCCWIGFMAWDNQGNTRVSKADQEAFYSRFACPRDLIPVSLVPIGYPERTPSAPPRRTAEEVCLRRVTS